MSPTFGWMASSVCLLRSSRAELATGQQTAAPQKLITGHATHCESLMTPRSGIFGWWKTSGHSWFYWGLAISTVLKRLRRFLDAATSLSVNKLLTRWRQVVTQWPPQYGVHFIFSWCQKSKLTVKLCFLMHNEPFAGASSSISIDGFWELRLTCRQN